jgi:toxin ParE1/3/4
VKIRWLSGANRSLRMIHAHIAAENPRAAKHVARRVRSATQRLARFPQSGRRGEIAGTLELVVPKLPYLVVYRVAGGEVHILRVFHAAMDRPVSLH